MPETKWFKVFEDEKEAFETVKERTAVLLKAEEYEVCLVRFQDKLYALTNACPHQRASLSDGTVNSFGEIICPLHFYRYNLQNGRECNERSQDAQTFPVKWEQGIFYVGIPKN